MSALEDARTPFQAALADSGLTYRELARQAGVGLTTMRSWACGAATPRADKAEAVARVLGRPVDELFTTTRQHDLPLVPTPAKTLTTHEVLAAEATGDPKWGQRAACSTGQHDCELWFPETPGQATTAREVCATCPVVGDCRDAFLDTPAKGLARQEMNRGIWAGLRGAELREAAQRHGLTAAREGEREARRHLQWGTAAARNDGRPARPTRDRPAQTPATRLSRLLEDQDLTNRTVAQAAGVPESTLGNWVRGERVPTATAAAKVAAVLNVPVTEVFDRVDPDFKRIIDRASPTLRQALEDRGLSLHAAAKQAGLGNKTPYRWLDGSRTPTAEAAEKLANVVGVPAATLFPHVHTSDYRVLPPGHRLRAGDVALPTPEPAATRARETDLDLQPVQRPVRERADRGRAW